MSKAITAAELVKVIIRLHGQQEITADEMEKVRKRFRPGMKVRNTISGGTGTLRADSDHPKQLDISGVWMLPVNRRHLTGQNAGKKHETCWSILNIEII